MTIKIDQIADAIISAPGSTIKVLDFIPANDITTSSLSFVEIDNGTDTTLTSFHAPVSGSYIFSVDLDTISSGVSDAHIYFRILIDKGTANEKIVAPDIGYWQQIHTTVSIHRQMSFMSPPVILLSGAHTLVLEWSVSNGSATARMSGAYSYVYINALSSGASGAGGILLDSYSILSDDATYNDTNWTDILIESGGYPLQVSFEAIVNESIGVNLILDAYNYSSGASPRYADFRLVLDDITEVAWARQRFNNTSSYEEEIGLTAYVPDLTKGPHIIKAQVKVENSEMTIAFNSGSSRGKLEIIRFRGGLVPIQKDGYTIASTPSALNFEGTSLNITESVGVVSFEFNKSSSTQDGYLSSSDWNSFNNKVSDPMTTAGDLIYRDGSNVTSRLPLGTNGYILSSDGTTVLWKSVPAAHDAVTLDSYAQQGGLSLDGQEISFQVANTTSDGYLSSTDWNIFNNKITDPLTTRGDLVYRNSSNITDRLALGADGYVLTSDGYDIYWEESAGGTYTNAEPSVIEVGGIEVGTTFSNTTFSEFMDLLLYPELFPTLTNPSSTFTISPSGLREVGEIISTISVSSTFNRGSISPAYGTSGYRSGLPNEYVYTGTDIINNTSTSLTDAYSILNYEVVLGTQSWTGRVAYDAGEQPLSSKGNNYDSPLSAGNTSIVTRSISGVYPIFATTVNITTMTKQSLVAHGSTVTTNMVLESGSDKQSVEFPVAYGTIAQLSQYNTLSGLWDIIDLATFTVSDITKTINGYTINYKKYTHNGSLVGSRILRWSI